MTTRYEMSKLEWGGKSFQSGADVDREHGSAAGRHHCRMWIQVLLSFWGWGGSAQALSWPEHSRRSRDSGCLLHVFQISRTTRGKLTDRLLIFSMKWPDLPLYFQRECFISCYLFYLLIFLCRVNVSSCTSKDKRLLHNFPAMPFVWKCLRMSEVGTLTTAMCVCHL